MPCFAKATAELIEVTYCCLPGQYLGTFSLVFLMGAKSGWTRSTGGVKTTPFFLASSFLLSESMMLQVAMALCNLLSACLSRVPDALVRSKFVSCSQVVTTVIDHQKNQVTVLRGCQPCFVKWGGYICFQPSFKASAKYVSALTTLGVGFPMQASGTG